MDEWPRITICMMVIVLVITGCQPPADPDVQIALESSPTLILYASGKPSPCSLPAVSSIPSPFYSQSLPIDLLITITDHARTHFVAYNVSNNTNSTTEARSIGKIHISNDHRFIAYQVLNELNPADNLVVVTDLVTGESWQVEPIDKCAAFGFALDGAESRLAVLYVAMRGRFKPAEWQIVVMELERDRKYVLGPSEPQELAFEPVAWSTMNDALILRGIVPFHVYGGAGLWMINSDGSHLRPILRDDEFVGQPVLSPTGDLLAYFTSAVERFPEGYVAGMGEPPANEVRLLDLIGSEDKTLLTNGSHVFSGLVWDVDSKSLLFQRGVWQSSEIPLRFDEIVSLPIHLSDSTPTITTKERVIDLMPCDRDGIAHLTADGSEVILTWEQSDVGQVSQWSFEGVTVDILACR